MRRGWRATVLGVGLVSGMAGCGDDGGTPTSVAAETPAVAGSYSAGWTLQVLRRSDGFQKEFSCWGRMTLSSTTTGTLTGFVTVETLCPATSFDVSGRVLPGGVVEITSGGPRPPEGPCPGGSGVRFTGQATPATGRATQLSLRGVTEVTCPEFGEHQFTYLVEANR